MYCKQIIPILLGMLAVSPVLAQEESGEKPNPCTVKPIFHCVQSLDDGTFLGHFGYTTSCVDDDELKTESYIDIGDENFFSPGDGDRGQSKIFSRGKNVDVFEVEFSSKEIKKGIELVWNVMGRTARVDYSKTSDAELDCKKLR
jgi:hypothetical protein